MTITTTTTSMLRLTTEENFRGRILLAALSQRPLTISRIRADEQRPGITEAERRFLDVVLSLCDDTHLSINQTGTQVLFRPGQLVGSVNGKPICVNCTSERGLSYFVELIAPLLVFCKHRTTLVLAGATHSPLDISIDSLVPTLTLVCDRVGLGKERVMVSAASIRQEQQDEALRVRKAGGDEEDGDLVDLAAGGGNGRKGGKADARKRSLVTVTTTRQLRDRVLATAGGACPIKIEQRARAVAPGHRGMVVVSCDRLQRDAPVPVHWVQDGRVKSVSGTAWVEAMTPQMTGKLIDGARSVLNNLLPNVYIQVERGAKGQVAEHAGCGLSLLSETTKGCVKATATVFYNSLVQGKGEVGEVEGEGDSVEGDSVEGDSLPPSPRSLGRQAAAQLVYECQFDGVVDRATTPVLLLLTSLCSPEKLSIVRIPSVTPQAAAMLRDIKRFLGVTFALHQEENSVVAKCTGFGLKNMGRRVAF